MAKDKWEIITEFEVKDYTCGLRAGDTVKLIKSFEVTQEGRVTELVQQGEAWTVLKGSQKSPSVVWLRRPSGKIHTWDDNDKIFEFFEIIQSEKKK